MKYTVYMMLPHERIIDADTLAEADKEARRLQALGNNPDGTATTKLLKVLPIIDEEEFDTDIPPAPLVA
ncbi:hypothetical protein LCGC14_3121540 [marine sediment metagenome]|uniref:Uncharacterized protein n=1 Tax=marine sediment metagenome TaxID=412755 RepID=A0A0F8W2D4_9ZZZZ